MIKSANLMLVDSDAYTSSLLLDELSRRGLGDVRCVSSLLDLPAVIRETPPDAVIFNLRSEEQHGLMACSTVRMLAPQAAIIVIVSPGPSLKAAREWSAQTGCIDAFIEKPLSGEPLFLALGNLLRAWASSRALETRAERLSNLVPEGALNSLENPVHGEAEMFDAAVLFTDIRGSSGLISTTPPREFFILLNQLLSSQAREIVRFEGSVIKYTGDGVMAIFRGMGRSYLALSCALELARNRADRALPFGTGVAQGLVLAGLIGDSDGAGQRRQYDIIGATFHLAARLCSNAEPGEVITTSSIHALARLDAASGRHIGPVSIRGFDNAIDCISFRPSAR